MNDPKTELRKYLEKLIHQFLFIIRMDDELHVMQEWLTKPDGYATLEIGASFFNLVQRTFHQTMLIEICKFIDSREEISLRKWLILAKENADNLEPTKFNSETGIREIIAVDNYQNIVDSHTALLDTHDKIITNLKARRDKALAHTDEDFFNNPEDHFAKYPLIMEDISGLIKTINDILQEHGVYLFEKDIDMRVHTVNNLERVLQFTRGFERAQKDKKLHEKDIYIIKYKWDVVKDEQ